MTTIENTVDLLNRLVQVNEDRKQGYQKALDKAGDPTLKALFDQYAKQSGKYIVDLGLVIESYGGIPTEKTTIAGDVYRAWMDVKDVMTTNERKSTLESCERGEDAALSTYKKVIEDMGEVDNNILGTLAFQQEHIEMAHDHIKSLRDNV
ncbi:MAG TPA: PA2169 family four-helix-bundle protein [Arachidicoccus sp.]|nr:PA2169 family four-helix-bundle protein [Arachidicoccus sp.]